jgi:hypothetical protein
MRTDEDFEIGGERYKIRQFSATKGTKIFTRLLKVAGEPISKMISAGSAAKKNDAATSNELIAEAVGILASKLDENDTLSLVKELLESVQVYDKKGSLRDVGNDYFDVHFQGRIGLMFKVVGQVIAFQYKDFFSEFASLVGLAGVAKQPASESPST